MFEFSIMLGLLNGWFTRIPIYINGNKPHLRSILNYRKLTYIVRAQNYIGTSSVKSTRVNIEYLI